MSAAQAGSQVLWTAVQSALGSALAAGLVLALTAGGPWLGRGGRSGRGQFFGTPLALGVATAVAFVLSRGLPSFPPAQALHWLFYLALAGGVFGALEARARAPSHLARASFSVLVPLVLLEFQRRLHWGRVEGVLWTAGLAAWLFLLWSTLASLEARSTLGASATLGLACATALAAGCVAFAGGGLFAQLPGALALAVGICALLGFARSTSGLGSSGAAPFVLLYGAMIWAARFLYELSSAGFALLSLAPFAWLLALALPPYHPRRRRVLAILGPGLVAAIALWFEWRAAPPPSPY